ncbi:MAG TPA: ATP-dependent Clp protease proteolytic subunit [Tepidisphaeraceae bacterium]|nr:ATP-dependent Clp protease proteolytic subunit [Tepidisphaeraceae bacterium]
MSVTLKIVFAALMVLSFRAIAPASEISTAPAGGHGAAVVIRLSGEVDDYSRDMLFKHFRQAEADGAKTVILEINSYGGLVTSGMDISRFLRGQSHIHTIAFVDDKAISAGAMIAIACDEIVMSRGGVLGDCAPIRIDPTGRVDPVPTTERAKFESPVLEDFEESARRNGYSLIVADAMVRVRDTVYLIQDPSGKTRIENEANAQKLIASGKWKPAEGVTNPIDSEQTLLTVGPDMAHRLGLSQGTFDSIQALAAARGLNIVADLTPNLGDHLVEAFNSAGARFVLLVVFLLSLYIALHAPGHGAAEAVSVLAMGFLIGIPLLTGYAQWWEIVMIFIGLALCAFEIFVFPGHGLSLGIGTLMVLFGLLMTFAGKDASPGWLPHSPETWHNLQRGLGIMVGAMAASVVGAMLLRPFLPRLPMFRKLILTDTSSGTVPSPAGAPQKAGEDVWPFVGTVGVAVSDLRPGGIVQFPYGSDARNAPVVSLSGFITAGSKVLVQEAKGNRIAVRGV